MQRVLQIADRVGGIALDFTERHFGAVAVFGTLAVMFGVLLMIEQGVC